MLYFQFSSVAQSCLTVCDPMNHSTPGLPVHHQLPEFTQTHVESEMPSSHLILCRPLLLLPSIPPSIRVFSNESTLRMRWPTHILEFQLQHQSFQRTPRAGLLCLFRGWTLGTVKTSSVYCFLLPLCMSVMKVL